MWLLLGVLHLTQAIWLHGGQGIPAGLGDGRFNQLVLEHGFQSWQGHYTWSSPGQFFPTAHTLGWSDTHLGTLPIYGALRTLSLSPERAWQVWFVVCATLNLIMGSRLLRLFGLHPWLNGPICFAAFAGLPAVWLAGTHPQLLPLFPGLWALAQLHQFASTRHGRDLIFFTGGLAAQFAAGPYLAFFTGLVAGVGLLIYVGLRGKASPPSAPPPAPPRFPGIVWTGIGLIAGAINLRVYLQAVSTGTERPMIELIDLCPTWVSWFSASPAAALFPAGWPAYSAELSEHVLFAGFLPWLGALAAIVIGVRFRSDPLARGAALLGAIALGLILFTVRWPNGFSGWLFAAELIEPLRGFRAIGRIVVFTHALMLGAAGLLLSFLLRTNAPFRLPRWSVALLCGALVIEGLGSRQPHYRVDQSVARREAVVAAWQKHGDAPMLAFAPGFTNQTDPQLHLDAWAAALSRQRVTLNGYSGGAPSSHVGFIWTPTAANAQELAQRVGLAPADVSVVTQFDAATADALGYEFYSGRVLQALEGFALSPHDWTLFAPPERFEYDAGVFYQFTPNAEVRFRLPPDAKQLTFLTGGRPGSYSEGGDSDGYSLAWSVTDAAGHALAAAEEIINPRDVPAHRGFLPRQIDLPSGSDRLITFSFGPGPSGSNNWDWPLLGRLQVR